MKKYILVALLLSLVSSLCNAQVATKHDKSKSAHKAVKHHKAGITGRNSVSKKHVAVKKHNRKVHSHIAMNKIPVIPVRAITIDDQTSTAVIEVKNGNVFYNDSFLFKIKSLRHEDDKVTVNYVAPAPAINIAPGDLSADKSGNAELGVFTCSYCDDGALINDLVPNSPADEAGLEPGDVIVRINDKEIDSKNDLVEAIQSYKPGDRVAVGYIHYGRFEKTFALLDNKSAKLPGNCEETERQQDCHCYYYRGYRW